VDVEDEDVRKVGDLEMDASACHIQCLGLVSVSLMTTTMQCILFGLILFRKIDCLPDCSIWYNISMKRLIGKFTMVTTNYQHTSWLKILNCLSDEELHVSGGFLSGIIQVSAAGAVQVLQCCI